MNNYLIVEKEFIQMLTLDNLDSKYQHELLEFLQNEFSGYHLICDISNEDEYFEFSKENPIWRALADKNIEIQFVDNCDLSEILKTNIISQALVLLTNENDTDVFIENDGFVIKPNNLDEVWFKLRQLSKETILSVSKSSLIDSENKLDSWRCLENFMGPVGDLIIFDKYILSDGDNQKMEDNLLPLLEVLLKNSNKKVRPCHITIISEFDKSRDITRREIEQDSKPYLIRIHKRISSYLESKGIKNFDLNIIRHNKGAYPSSTINNERFEGFHSRYIISTYNRLRCDNSFNFFKKNGSINGDTELNVGFTMFKPSKSKAIKDLVDFKSYIDKLKNSDLDTLTEPYKTQYYPHKNNPLYDNLTLN